MTIILASASPRRADLLRAAGLEFTVRVADIDETQLPDESPRDYVTRLARQKAQAVARPDETVLGADTTVVFKTQGGNEIAGKPVDAEDARRMLRLLSGQWHEVLTAVALTNNDSVVSEVAVTRVRFAAMTEAEIDWYVETGEPFDKAGAYGIQGFASRFVEAIEGNYANVVGLPVQAVYRLLRSTDFSR